MPLYGADRLKDLPSGSQVFVVESAPAAEALWKRNIAAVGTMTGASATPGDDSLRDLRAYVVICWPGNDAPGRSHMERIGVRLDALGIEHCEFHWSDALPKGDAVDYFAFGGTVAGLQAMIGEREVGEEEPAARQPSDVAAFPVEILPKPMRDLVIEGAKAIICPPDLIAIPMLVAASAAIGATRCVEVKPGYRQFPSLRGVTIARAGERKSPACELAVAPIKDRQNELAAQYERELQEYHEQEGQQNPHGPGPVLEQLWTSDTTLEALVDVLLQNQRGIAFLGDEISGWALAMNQYRGGRGADRKVWLQMHDCRSTIVNRRSRKGATHLARPFVAVTGTIQPDILPELSDERGREDGFMHRILFSYPEPVEPEWTEAVVSEPVKGAYTQLFSALWQLDFDEDEVGALRPHVVKFTPAGKAQWVKWITDHYREISAPRFPDNLRGPWAKLEAYALRLALIVHLCRVACGETRAPDIDEVTMAAAGDLIEYFKSHTRKVYTLLHATPEDKQMLTALAWIKRQPGKRVTARDLQHAGVARITRAEEARALLERLQDRGYGQAREQTSKHGRPSFVFTLDETRPTTDKMASDQAGSAA